MLAYVSRQNVKNAFFFHFLCFKIGAKIHSILTHENLRGEWGEIWDKNAYIGVKVSFLGVNENFIQYKMG